VLRADLQLIACFCHCVAFVFFESLMGDFSVVAKLSAASMAAGARFATGLNRHLRLAASPEAAGLYL